MNTTPIERLYGTTNVHGKPVGRLLITPVKVDVTMGGFTIPEVDQIANMPNVAEVVMVSDEVTHLKPGDLIFYGRFSGLKFTDNDKDYIVINDDEAPAKLDRSKINIAK